MRFIVFTIGFLLHITLLTSDSNKPKKKQLPDSNSYNGTNVQILENNKIRIKLPFLSGFRKDLYDINGNLLESEYYNADGNFAELEPGVSKENRSYNNFGLVEKIETFDMNQKSTSLTLIKYNEQCRDLKKEEECASEISYFKENKNPSENEEGVHKYLADFDLNCISNEKRKAGECKISEKRINKDKKLVADKDGNAKVIRTFDQMGNLNLHEIYDKFNKIKNKVIYAYDYKCIGITNQPKGCIILYEYTNQIAPDSQNENSKSLNYGKKIINYDLNCVQVKKNSEKCILKEENYDLNGKLSDVKEKFSFGCIDYSLELGAYAKRISNYDSNGNEILREFYNSKNELIEDSTGGAKYVYAYNQECLNKGNKAQYCRTLSEIYDKTLKLNYKAIYDQNCVKKGMAEIEYPNYCTAWKEIYKTVTGQPTEKILITKANFDIDGYKKNVETYNINGKLDLKTIYYFDKENLIKKENLDNNGNLTEDKNGIATYLYKYGNEKFTTLEETYGNNGVLKPTQDGIAQMKFQYNSNCLKKKKDRYECASLEEYFDEKGNSVDIQKNNGAKQNYSKVIREFNNNGILNSEIYFKKGKKNNKEQKKISKYSYNEMGELTEELYYGKDGLLKQKNLYEYDSNCKSLTIESSCNTSIAHFDNKNNLINKEMINGSPYAKEVTTYNLECLKTILNSDDCMEKKEYFNSSKKIVYAEYFHYLKPPSITSEIKLIKLKLTQNKTPFSVEFIK